MNHEREGDLVRSEAEGTRTELDASTVALLRSAAQKALEALMLQPKTGVTSWRREHAIQRAAAKRALRVALAKVAQQYHTKYRT